VNEEYKPNSHKFREGEMATADDKKIEKVVKGKVRTKPKSGISKISEVFIAEDAKNVKSYILMDVLVPAVKKAISDIVRDGIDMLLYGESPRKKVGSASQYVSYRDYSRRDDDRFRDPRDSRVRSGYNHDDIILETRGEAEEVLTRMDELIDTYGVVSVADLYDLIGKTCEYTDNKYGWTNIRNAEPIRVRDGYMLKLPKALPIK
jgi:hypothetical protein